MLLVRARPYGAVVHLPCKGDIYTAPFSMGGYSVDNQAFR